MTRSNIASAINAAHERVEASKKAGVEAATKCGRLMIEAKETVKHGGWNAWLKQHCKFSPRTAQLYMSVARYLEDGDPAKAQRVADLSLREVARIVGDTGRKGPLKRLAPTDEAALDDMLFHWSEGRPESGIEFATRVFAQGQINADERDRWIDAASRNFAASPVEATTFVIRTMHEHLPEDQMRRVISLAERHDLTMKDVAKVFEKVVAERQSA